MNEWLLRPNTKKLYSVPSVSQPGWGYCRFPQDMPLKRGHFARVKACPLNPQGQAETQGKEHRKNSGPLSVCQNVKVGKRQTKVGSKGRDRQTAAWSVACYRQHVGCHTSEKGCPRGAGFGQLGQSCGTGNGAFFSVLQGSKKKW